MLGPKHGFAQSADCTAQSVEPRFEKQSMVYLRKLWIAQYKEHKLWIYTSMDMCSNIIVHVVERAVQNMYSILRHHCQNNIESCHRIRFRL